MMMRPHGIPLDLPANAPNVHPEILLRVAVRVAPHSGEELAVSHRAARVLNQDAQQLPFGPGEMDRNAAALDRGHREIDHRTIGFDDMRWPSGGNELRSAKLGAHARLQLDRAEGLRDVVVGAGVEHGCLFLDRASRAQHDDRRGRP